MGKQNNGSQLNEKEAREQLEKLLKKGLTLSEIAILLPTILLPTPLTLISVLYLTAKLGSRSKKISTSFLKNQKTGLHSQELAPGETRSLFEQVLNHKEKAEPIESPKELGNKKLLFITKTIDSMLPREFQGSYANDILEMKAEYESEGFGRIAIGLWLILHTCSVMYHAMFLGRFKQFYSKAFQKETKTEK